MNPLDITITPTAQLAAVGRTPVRVWDGVTADGRACKVYVALIGFPDGQQPADLETALIPRAVITATPFPEHH